ncbi:TlpA family protein disulfide reductase [Thermus thermamylovorans]|uniref:Redoxin domain-containing protein n=1 Tax=Thermus thermamylovorans TaxID=2509362 RepID=A0A4Q9AW24_9DEIN|nr:redoxin domain-containing protein [Thermus thermamylovorans]TBH15350.1 redoxin domain-containing protein [Thermus thermamylovorans]
MRGWLWVLLVLGLGGLFLWGMQRDPRELPSVLAQERRPAPDFTLPLLPPYRGEWGETLRLADHLGQRPILLNFWASWCFPACYEEAPVLEEAWRRYRDRVLFLGVNVQDREADALRFVGQFGLTFPSVFDPRGRVGVDYGMYGVPETFVIDGEGRVMVRHAGAIDRFTLERYLQEVLR